MQALAVLSGWVRSSGSLSLGKPQVRSYMGVSNVIMRKQALTVIEVFLNAAQMNLNIQSILSIPLPCGQ